MKWESTVFEYLDSIARLDRVLFTLVFGVAPAVGAIIIARILTPVIPTWFLIGTSAIGVCATIVCIGYFHDIDKFWKRLDEQRRHKL